MQIKRVPRGYMVRLDEGEEVFSLLGDFINRHDIESGWISGIGTFSAAGLSYFDATDNQYKTRSFNEKLEVLSLEGNVAISDEAPFFHLHAVLGREDLTTIGGHLMSGITSMTMEIFVADFETKIIRKEDPGNGLNLLNLNPIE